MIQKLCSICAVFIGATLLAGCALTQSGLKENRSAQELASQEPVDTILYIVEVDDSLVPIAFADTPSVSPLHEAKTSLEKAEGLCEEQRFAPAESLLAVAVEHLESVQDTSPSITDTLDSLYSRISGIYSDVLPPEFLDQLPEQISVMVMERVLARSLDSLEVSTEDSSALSTLFCQKGVDYDFPMVWNDRVYTALTFFAHSKRSPIKRWLERSVYYLPMMKEIVTANGLPSEIAYLPLIESGFSPHAYSHAHACGLWQFISATGRRYGLRQSYWLDERRDPIKSTQSAVAYLKDLYDEFQDWHLALAAYNCGEGRVRRAIRRAGTDDYWSLKLPRETMYYVPKFIASLIVAKNPSCFGIEIPEAPALEADTVFFSDCIDLSKIAEGTQSSAEKLRKDNPHILHWCTPPDHDSVLLYLPKGSRQKFDQFYASIPEDEKVRWYRYKIRRGDNLISIAGRFKTSVRAIRSVNRLRGSRIVAGKHLFIPIPVTARVATNNDARPLQTSSKPAASEAATQPPNTNKVKYRVQRGETLTGLSELFKVKIREIASWNGIPSNSRLREGQVLVLYLAPESSGNPTSSPKPPLEKQPNVAQYTVRKGDNLYTIAKRLEVTWKDLADWNGLKKHRPVIFPGQTLLYLASKENVGADQSSRRPRNSDDEKKMIRYRVQSGDNLSTLADLFDVTLTKLMKLNNLTKSSILRPGDILNIPSSISTAGRNSEQSARILYHKVRSGDTLWDIARRYGVTVNKLCQANGFGSRAVLRPGDTLRVITSEDI